MTLKKKRLLIKIKEIFRRQQLRKVHPLDYLQIFQRLVKLKYQGLKSIMIIITAICVRGIHIQKISIALYA